jgi:hypothetical protein
LKRFPSTVGQGNNHPFMLFEIINWNKRNEPRTVDSQQKAFESVNGSIALPIPDAGLNDNTSISWGEEQMVVADELSLEGFATAGWTAMKAKFAEMALKASGSIGSFYKQAEGKTINDFTSLLFGGVDLRSFEFSYTFYPFDEEEKNKLEDIIYYFKNNAITEYPDKEKLSTVFVEFPSIFNIYVVTPGRGRDLFVIKSCACTGVNVNYDGDGRLSTFKDGSPLKVGLTLSFRELERLSRTDIISESPKKRPPPSKKV